jgi:LysR family hydrogen peroxide-inducible transcriptional activator
VLKKFSDLFPQAELSVYENLTDHLLDDLIQGKIEVGIMSAPIDHKLIATHDLFTESLLAAVSQHHDPITKASIKVKDLQDFPFIALNEVHCFGEQVQTFCYQHNVNVDIVCHTSQLSTVHSCIALGLGVSLIPQMMASSDTSGFIKYRPVSDTEPRRTIVAAYHSGRNQSFLAQQFVDLVRDEYYCLIDE